MDLREALKPHRCRLRPYSRQHRSVIRCARKKPTSRRQPQQPEQESDITDGNVPAWKQDLARLQQSLTPQQPNSSSGASAAAQQPQVAAVKQPRTPPTFRRRDSLSSLSADKQFSTANTSAADSDRVGSNRNSAATQAAQPRRQTPSGTGFGRRTAAAEPSQRRSDSEHPSSPHVAPSSPSSPREADDLAALRENFLPTSGAAQLRQSPFKGGIAGRGTFGQPPKPTQQDLSENEPSSEYPPTSAPRGFGPTGVGRQEVSRRFPGGRDTAPDEPGDGEVFEEVISVGLEDWPDDGDDDDSGWVDVSKGKRPAARSPPHADPLADLVFSNEGWSVEDLGSGPKAVGNDSRASAPVAEAEPYAVEISRTATLPAPAAVPFSEQGKRRKHTRRRDATARAISAQGPKPTDEPTLAAQLAAIPALSRLSPHEIRALEKMQLETSANNASVKAIAARKKVAARKTHRRLHIMGGKLRGRSLLSGDAETTRPMMEMVRQAVFNMLLAQSDGPSHVELPPDSTWLDLFAGTGAVGLEALSRGCSQASFVELDSWVVDKVLEPNLESCGMLQNASIHCMRAEDFVRRSAAGSGRLQKSFDFISVCPPYLQVSYPELFDLLEASSLLHANTVLILEYPKQLAHEMRPQLGPLHKIRDRRDSCLSLHETSHMKRR
ncbi:hypothetical protein WJX74_000359 [Apatococcus lobatus]|uniref:Uncharacterized protein n=1 Tax=Apatococcus lobatus TaxID=904363 RepID=A0AAW1RV11_9CHLO